MTTKQATFKNMSDGTAEDWQAVGEGMRQHMQALPKRIVAHMELLRGDYGGFPIDRLEHCLQSATRAYRDGKDEEYVVCALLHDIGDTLGAYNHADLAATILEPFVSEQNYWMVKHHGIFQGYYFFHYFNLDRHGRDKFKDHPYYQVTADFCENYDQNCFDADYDNESLAFFVPMVERVFAQPKKSLYKTE